MESEYENFLNFSDFSALLSEPSSTGFSAFSTFGIAHVIPDLCIVGVHALHLVVPLAVLGRAFAPLLILDFLRMLFGFTVRAAGCCLLASSAVSLRAIFASPVCLNFLLLNDLSYLPFVMSRLLDLFTVLVLQGLLGLYGDDYAHQFVEVQDVEEVEVDQGLLELQHLDLSVVVRPGSIAVGRHLWGSGGAR
ncbi:hypothetical protein MTO96_017403 [Rhipicephalus appendiculatus]